MSSALRVQSSEFNLLCPFQKRWITEPAPLALAEKSRRIGWTWTQALAVVMAAAAAPASNPFKYYHSSTDQTASVEFIDYCRDWGQVLNAVAKVTEESEVIDEQKVTSLVAKFANGSKITAGSSNPKFFRSKGGAVGLDEFAFHADGRELYKAAHATAMFWGYPLRAWSSHNGEETYFNSLINEARAGRLKAAVHRVTILDAVADGIVERILMRKKRLSDVPAVDEGARKAWLDELRSTCPDQATWDEEYMCVPSSAGSTFLPADLIRSCEEANLKVAGALDEEVGNGKWEGGSWKGGLLYAGYDVGRTQDLSVLTVAERVGDVLWTRALIRLKGCPYQDQFNLLSRLLSNGAVKRICIDKGLIGGMLTETLQDKFGKYRVEGVQLTAPVQSELAMPLRAAFEDRSIRIPADPQLREALRKPRKLVVGNNVRFETPRDNSGHCDEFWSLVLMLAAADLRQQPLHAPLAHKPMGW